MNKHLSSRIAALLLIVSFAVSLSPTAFAQAAPSAAPLSGLAAIEAKADARRKELGIPGMALAIVKDGKILLSKGFGYRDLENNVPVTADTEFSIGSATKAFTALTVLMAQDEGKLSLDDPPKKLLPYFRMFDPETDKNITLRDLLCHSSGLNRTDLAMITGRLSRKELIQVAGEARPTAKLREKFQYQNIMYTAAGEAASVAEKKSWNDLIRQRIFAPLGMANSTVSVEEMEKTKDHSFGYSYNFDTKETRKLPFRDIVEVAPAGSINSSANDMAKWIGFVLSGGVVNGKRLVSENGFSEWTKPQMKITPDGKMSYGLGWFIQDWNGLKVLQHGGNIDGFNAMVAMIPEKKLGFVMLTNVSASPLGSELMPIVWSDLLPELSTAAATAVSADEANLYTGKYRVMQANVDIEVKAENNSLVMVVPGQPQYTLGRTGPRQFKLVGAPDGFAVRFDPESGTATEMFLQQPQGNATLPRVGPDGKTAVQPEKKAETPEPAKSALISADDLYAKALEAIGGEENWKKLNSRKMAFEINFEHQGVRGSGTSYSKAPDMTATETTLTALGKKIALVWEYFDGKGGEESYTFGPVDKYTGKRLEDIKFGSDFYSMLGWGSKFKKISVLRTGKVGDEETYVVRFEPVNGTPYTDQYSTRTFLLLKRDSVIVSSTGGPNLPFSILFEDYRKVDGVMIPFRTKNESVSNGTVVTTVVSVEHNVPIADSLFTPRELTL